MEINGISQASSNSKAFGDALVNKDNPTQVLCEKWDAAVSTEQEELAGIISELRPFCR